MYSSLILNELYTSAYSVMKVLIMFNSTMKIPCSSTMEVLVVLSGTMEVLVVLNVTMEYTCNNTVKVLVVSSGIIEVLVVLLVP